MGKRIYREDTRGHWDMERKALRRHVRGRKLGFMIAALSPIGER